MLVEVNVAPSEDTTKKQEVHYLAQDQRKTHLQDTNHTYGLCAITCVSNGPNAAFYSIETGQLILNMISTVIEADRSNSSAYPKSSK